MTVADTNLVWLDLEMTGLDVRTDCVIEIATIVTDKDLNILAEGPVLAIHQPDAVLDAMDKWNTKHHGKSGLIDRVKASQITEQEAQKQTLSFLKQYVPAGKSPMCGNTICQDRRFLHRVMPELEAYFHYRNLDVSTLKILAKLWAPKVANGFRKVSEHQALLDIRDSIEEMAYYRDHFINLSSTTTE